jgi:hypothetical protein
VIFCCKSYKIFWSSQYSVRVQVFSPHRYKFIVFPLAHRGTQRQNLEYCDDSTVQHILIYFLIWKWTMFSVIDFGMMNMQMTMKRLEWLQFPRKINRHYACLPHCVCDTVFTDWPALIKNATSSPAVCTQVQENLSLFFFYSHPVVFCNNIVNYSINKHNILVINIKNSATCFGSLNHHQTKYKT